MQYNGAGKKITPLDNSQSHNQRSMQEFHGAAAKIATVKNFLSDNQRSRSVQGFPQVGTHLMEEYQAEVKCSPMLHCTTFFPLSSPSFIAEIFNM